MYSASSNALVQGTVALRQQVMGQPLYVVGLHTNKILLFFKGTLAAHTDNNDGEKQSRNCPALTQHQLHKTLHTHKRAKAAIYQMIN